MASKLKQTFEMTPDPSLLGALDSNNLMILSSIVFLRFCLSQKDMQLFIAESTVEPLCSETFLLLPVILDGVMLSVASLKTSSLCWAWVLS